MLDVECSFWLPSPPVHHSHPQHRRPGWRREPAARAEDRQFVERIPQRAAGPDLPEFHRRRCHQLGLERRHVRVSGTEIKLRARVIPVAISQGTAARTGGGCRCHPRPVLASRTGHRHHRQKLSRQGSAGVSPENKKSRKSNEPSTAGAASQGSQFGPGSFYLAAKNGSGSVWKSGSDNALRPAAQRKLIPLDAGRGVCPTSIVVSTGIGRCDADQSNRESNESSAPNP